MQKEKNFMFLFMDRNIQRQQRNSYMREQKRN